MQMNDMEEHNTSKFQSGNNKNNLYNQKGGKSYKQANIVP